MQNFDQTQEMLLMEGMMNEQKLRFHQALTTKLKSPKKAFWLAFFFGHWGAHHFYLGNKRKGWLYVGLFFTGISVILAFIDWFRIKNEARKVNADIAEQLANSIKAERSVSVRQASA